MELLEEMEETLFEYELLSERIERGIRACNASIAMFDNEFAQLRSIFG